MRFYDWLYRGGRPNWLARALNRTWAAIHALGVAPNYLVTLEVPGRRSGRLVRFPMVMVAVGGERYFVSMLGANTNWIRNVQAAGGYATLRHGRCEDVRLEEVPVDRRAPLLQLYVRRAPGGRVHLPIPMDATLAAFAQIASRYPVFQVLPRQAT